MRNQSGAAPILILVAIIGVVAFLVITSSAPFNNNFLSSIFPKESSQAAGETWAFEETFDYPTTSPSQSLLPKTFDYITTHRTHPNTPDGNQADGTYGSFPADHGHDCTFDGTTIQHDVTTDHRSNTQNPDNSFFICNNHMMSSMGHVEGYSVSAFWPRQEFDFSQGGTLEWDVNINDRHSRSFWEVMIVPRDQMMFSSAVDWLPIDETYPKDRIVFQFGTAGGDSSRSMHVGTGVQLPGGIISSSCCANSHWRNIAPTDPALTDRRIRRKNQITITNNRIDWAIQKQDGTFSTHSINIPNGLPFQRGLVVFKTHAYTPEKDGNMNIYTFHWDNIRFTGPVLAPYEAHETANEVIKLNGTGATKTQTISLPHVGQNPVLTGQTHFGVKGAVKLSVNGNPDIEVNPLHYGWTGDCFQDGWGTFRVNINPAYLKQGANSFKWTYGPEPACSQAWWHNYTSIKATEIQFDGTGNPLPSQAPATPTPTPSPSPSPSAVPTGALTVDFNNFPQADLTGQNPSGVINWDSSSWEVVAPWKGLTTRNLGLRSQSITTGTFTLVQPRVVQSIQAYNGGTVASNVTLSCAGNPDKTVSVGVEQLATITTDWTNPCTTVTLSSSNAWNTNFDNLSLGPVSGSQSPQPSAQPSTQPSIAPSPSSAVPSPSPKPGDADGDNDIDIFDYNLVLGNFGRTGTNIPGDVDKDGDIDIFDYNLVLGNFGR